MTATFRSAASLEDSAHASTSITLTKPSGTAENDFLLAAIQIGAPGAITVATLDGWTLIGSVSPSDTEGSLDDDFSLNVYYRVAGSSEGADYTWTRSAGTAKAISAAIAAFSNSKSTAPVNASGTSSGVVAAQDTQGAGGGAVPAVNDTLQITVAGFRGDAGDGPPLGGPPLASLSWSLLTPRVTVKVDGAKQVVAVATQTLATPAAQKGSVATDGDQLTQQAAFGIVTVYLTPGVAPTITAITPDHGPKTGGEAVTITGTNFKADAAVTIGGAAATSVVVVSATTITCVTPAGTAGEQDLVVSDSEGTATF